MARDTAATAGVSTASAAAGIPATTATAGISTASTAAGISATTTTAGVPTASAVATDVYRSSAHAAAARLAEFQQSSAIFVDGTK